MHSHRKGIIAYLLIAFGLAWVGFETMYRSKGIPLRTVALAASAFAPAIACFVVRKWVTREGFADAGLRLHLRKWPFYLVAWLLPVAVVACVVILAPLFGAGTADFSLERGFQYMAFVREDIPCLVSPQPVATALHLACAGHLRRSDLFRRRVRLARLFAAAIISE